MLSVEEIEAELEGGDVLEVQDCIGDDGEDEELDFADLKPMDAMLMRMEDLVQEMERRHLHPKGFFNDDAKELQKYLNSEHESELEKLKDERREQRARSRLKAQLQKKRLQLEKQLREEHAAVANDTQIETWLTVVRNDETRPSARIDVNSVTARALAKALWSNRSLTSLDLSRNDLSDFAGAQLGRMLKRNAGLLKLELNENKLGPRTCRAFGDSLQHNETLVALHLESNPLTLENTELGGVSALAAALKQNKTLTCLSLWRCDLGLQSGADIAAALQENSAMTNLDVGNNGVSAADKRLISEKLEKNRKQTHQNDLKQRACAQQLEDEERARQAISDEERRARELEEWMGAQRDERAAKRVVDAQTRRSTVKEEERVKQEAEREAREEKAKAELAIKMKKAKKKGKK